MWFLCFLRKYTIHRASVEYRCEDYKLCPLFNRSQKKNIAYVYKKSVIIVAFVLDICNDRFRYL